MVPLFGYYFHGGYHPVGGSGKFADVLAAAVRERGGEVRLNCPVAKIIIENGRAAGLALADGRRIVARAVVTNADLKRTFLELIDPAELPGEFRARIAGGSSRRCRPSRSISGSISFPTSGPRFMSTADQSLGITAMSLVDRHGRAGGAFYPDTDQAAAAGEGARLVSRVARLKERSQL